MSSQEPQLHPIYAELERTGPRLPFDSMSAAEIRELSNKMFKENVAKLNLPQMHKEELFIDSHGRSIELIITRPPGTENTELPVLLFLCVNALNTCISRLMHFYTGMAVVLFSATNTHIM